MVSLLYFRQPYVSVISHEMQIISTEMHTFAYRSHISISLAFAFHLLSLSMNSRLTVASTPYSNVKPISIIHMLSRCPALCV